MTPTPPEGVGVGVGRPWTLRGVLSLSFIVMTTVIIGVQSSSGSATGSRAPTLESINVTCHDEGMDVVLNFNGLFGGVVFSKGHFVDPTCRWFTGTASKSAPSPLSVWLPSDRCGSAWHDDTDGRQLEHVLVIQFDPVVQAPGDAVRRLRCEWPWRRALGPLFFGPMQVGPILDVQEIIADAGDAVSCWMDVRAEAGSLLEGEVMVGETLSLVVHASDPSASFDVLVHDCRASPDAPELSTKGNKSGSASKNDTWLALSDNRGCPLRPRLLGPFFRTREARNGEAHAVAFAVMHAFKFPDAEHVHVWCSVSVCRNTCEDTCTQELTDARSQLGLTHPADDPPTTARPRNRGRRGLRSGDPILVHRGIKVVSSIPVYQLSLSSLSPLHLVVFLLLLIGIVGLFQRRPRNKCLPLRCL